jgi:hypothetical protein
VQVCYSSGAYICTLALCALLKQVVIWILTASFIAQLNLVQVAEVLTSVFWVGCKE